MADPERPQLESGSRWQTVRRRAGCLVGCLTEPFTILFLVLGGLIGGYLWGRKIERRIEAEQREGAEDDHD